MPRTASLTFLAAPETLVLFIEAGARRRTEGLHDRDQAGGDPLHASEGRARLADGQRACHRGDGRHPPGDRRGAKQEAGDDRGAGDRYAGPDPGRYVQGQRDRTLLLLGFSGALRRSEIVGLDVGELEMTDEGIVVTIRRPKTDQEGQGQVIAIPTGERLRPVETR